MMGIFPQHLYKETHSFADYITWTSDFLWLLDASHVQENNPFWSVGIICQYHVIYWNGSHPHNVRRYPNRVRLVQEPLLCMPDFLSLAHGFQYCADALSPRSHDSGLPLFQMRKIYCPRNTMIYAFMQFHGKKLVPLFHAIWIPFGYPRSTPKLAQMSSNFKPW